MVKNLLKSKNAQIIIFFSCFIALFLLYQYHTILFLRPQSIHQFRQTICTSITLNYYEHGMKFFIPEVHNLFSDAGTSGQSYAEFPIIYYFNAALWKIFGVHEYIPRLINILICLLGSFYLFKLLQRILSFSWALIISLLLFTSPVIAFYANNFLVDIPILYICFISIFYFFNYYEFKKEKDLYIFIFLSLLCMLLKPSGGTFFVAVIGLFILEKFNIVRFEKQIFTGTLIPIILFAVITTITVTWYVCGDYFNSIHGGHYTWGAYPIWRLDEKKIHSILIDFSEGGFLQFFSPATTFVLLFILICVFLSYKKINKLYFTLTILLLLGALAHALFWFELLHVHDYYMFIFFLPVVFIFISIGNYIKVNHPSLFYSMKTNIVFSIFLLINIWYCSHNICMRYGIKTTQTPFMETRAEIGLWNWYSWNYNCTGKAYETIEPYNRKLGIKPDDKVISFPDESLCISLYLMNQKGWNEYGNKYLERDDIKEKISLGAKYLFLSDTTLAKNSFVKPYTQNKIGQYKNVAVYSLHPPEL